MRRIEKRLKPFNDLDVLYHRAKFRGDRTTRPAVGAKIWCLYVFWLSVTLRVWRSVHSRVAYFQEILCHGLRVDFYAVFRVFFGSDCRLRCPRELTFVDRWRHNCRKIAVKNCEKSKNQQKGLIGSHMWRIDTCRFR